MHPSLGKCIEFMHDLKNDMKNYKHQAMDTAM